MSSINTGPQIVKNGLVLDLDASSVTSYPAIAVWKVECYSVFAGGLRSANYTVQYSDDNTNWTTAFNGVMSNGSSCGIITGTNRNYNNYSKHRYWRYVEETAVVGHHPRVSRIDFITKGGARYNLTTYTTDNCSDSGTYIVGTVSKDFGGSIWYDLSGNAKHAAINNSPTFTPANLSYFTCTSTQNFTISNPLGQPKLTQEWTVSAWVNIDTVSGAGARYLISGLNSGVAVEWYDSGTLLYLNGGADDYYTYGNSIEGSGWVMLSFLFRNADGYRKIFNNTTDITTSGPNNTSNPAGQSSTFTIADNMRGKISSIMIYNRVLSLYEISINYEAMRKRFGL